MKLRIKLLVTVFIIIFALVGCSSSESGSSSSGTAENGNTNTINQQNEQAGNPSSVKVGVLLPLTGGLAQIGENNKNGYDLAVEHINNAGGIQSLGGAKIELVYGDSQGKPDVGVSETERLIEREKVDVLTGAFQSNVTISATQTAERHKIPFINPVAIADVITQRDFKYTFQINAKASWFAREQVELLDNIEVNGKKPKRIALLYENTDFGMSTATAQKYYLEEKGYELVEEVSYPAGAADLTTELMRIKTANPDFVLQVSYIADAILIATTKDRLQLDVPFLDSAGGVADPAFIENVGQLAEGWLTVNQFNSDLPRGKELNEQFKQKYGTDMNGHAALNYQAMFVLKEALEQAGTLDKEQIRDSIASIRLEGDHPSLIMPYELLEFDDKGQASSSLIITQIQNGKHVTVWPAKFKVAEIVF